MPRRIDAPPRTTPQIATERSSRFPASPAGSPILEAADGPLYTETFRAICGNVEIIAPDGAEIEINGTPVVGSIEQHVRKTKVREQIREWVTGERDGDLSASAEPPEPPFFRIDGHAILGSIKVTGR